MLDMLGHSLHVRKPRKADDPRTGGFGDLDGYGVRYEDCAFVVIGEDLAECILLAVGHDGERLFEETSESQEILDLYYLGAVTLNKALEETQKAHA